MSKSNEKVESRLRRKERGRKKMSGTAERPRLSVFRSLRFVYAQVIDDLKGHTLASASSIKLGMKTGGIKAAEEVGKLIASRAKELKITKVFFDRSGFQYHGVIKALAESARKEGLEF